MYSTMIRLVSAAALIATLALPAKADFTAKDASAATITFFAFTCFTTKVCTAHVNVNNAGTEIFDATTPGYVRVASGHIAAGAQVDLLTMRQTKAAGTAAANSLLTGCVYNSTPPTLTDGQGASMQCDANGNQKVAGVGVTDNTAIGSITGSPIQGYAETSPTALTSGRLGYVSLDPTTRALRVNNTGQYPIGAVPYTASATGTTGATTATLAGAASVTTHLCWFSIRANATAAVTGNATVTGTITGTLNFTQWTAPTASGLGITEMIFNPCIPASAANTSIAVVSAAPGTGGVVSVSSGGYKI